MSPEIEVIEELNELSVEEAEANVIELDEQKTVLEIDGDVINIIEVTNSPTTLELIVEATTLEVVNGTTEIIEVVETAEPSPRFTVSETAPSNPRVGDLWVQKAPNTTLALIAKVG